MARFRASRSEGGETWGSRLLIIAGVIGALYLGREVLAPLALAGLLTIAALPAVAFLERRRVPRVPAVLLVLLVVLGALGGLLYVVFEQALVLAAELPQYESVLRGKLLEIARGSGPIARTFELLGRLGSSLGEPAPAQAAPVVIAAPSQVNMLGNLLSFATVLLAPITTFGITLLLMAFLLIQREDVRDRAVRLGGVHEMHRTTQAMGDAAARLGRFLLMQTLINASYGTLFGLGLWVLGVPSAPLWGALGFALRYVPYLGAPLSMLLPLAVTFATTEGWTTALLIIAWYAMIDGLISFALEPWLYGASTGVSPLALVLSSAFWAILWGPIGLILAPALTACLAILGKHIPALAFLEVLFGDTEPLPAPARFYQRMLAGDAVDAGRLLTELSEESTTQAAIDSLVLPAIARVSADRAGPGFSPAMVVRGARTLLRVLEPEMEPADGQAEVLVAPIGGALDRAAAAALLVALQDAGFDAAAATGRETGAALVVLVAADEPQPHRLVRAERLAKGQAGHTLVFAATAEARRALGAGRYAGELATSLDAVLEEARSSLGHATEPA